MPRYRTQLPQLAGPLFLTDGGLETTLVFHHGIDLPCFAAVDLVKDARGRQLLYDYFRPYLAVAAEAGCGFILESPTWRASADWAPRIGYTEGELERLNRESIALMERVRDDFERPGRPFVISACIGPRGDGYIPGERMTPDEARAYHAQQIGVLADTEADLITAMTLPYVDEAIGIVRAATDAGMPVVISFTVEVDGRLPTGEGLLEAVARVDRETGEGPAYYMINCAHPSHFAAALPAGDPRLERFAGLRANASRLSHAELDACEALDTGDPLALGAEYRGLLDQLPALRVLGGCCGTDHRHLAAIAAACLPAAVSPAE